MDDLDIMIIGGGMGGLTAALALHQSGQRVRVYERARELVPAGAGISLWSNGVKVLDRLGLGAGVRAIGGRMREMGYRTREGVWLTRFSLEPLVSAVGEWPYPVTRTDLQQLLLSALPPGAVQLGARCTAVEVRGDRVTALFEDGRRASAEVLIGADGTHSVVRELVLGERVERRYAGYVNFNGLVSASAVSTPPEAWVTFVGGGQRVALMPVGGDRFYFFFDVPLPPGAAPATGGVQGELARHFAGWADPVQQLIASLDVARTQRLQIEDLEPLPRLVRGRIALLGDAGHTTVPDLGQGGCQAMEDAWVLANALVTTNVGVEDALLRYQGARQERTAEIVLRARKRADVTHGARAEETEAWYRELAREDGSRIISALARTILGGPLH